MKRFLTTIFCALLFAGSALASTQRFERHPTYAAQLWYKTGSEYNWTILHDLRVEFVITEESVLHWYGSINLKHRNLVTGPVGYAIKASLRYAETCAALPTPPVSGINLAYWQSAQPYIVYGSKRAGNIASIAAHYAEVALDGRKVLATPGCYRLDWYGNSHSDAAPTTNGLIELNMNGDSSDTTDPYSVLFVDVTPVN